MSENLENEVYLDKKTKDDLKQIPFCTLNIGPRNKEKWNLRLKEELKCLINYVKKTRSDGNEWFKIKPKDKTGIKWEGKCWYYYEHIKYEFVLNFEIPITYPKTCPDFCLPELINKTKKMYEGGSICQTLHFKPLWKKNAPKFGIAHGLYLGLAPWLAAEIPVLLSNGKIKKK